MNTNLTLFPVYLLDNNTVVELARRISPPELRKTACDIVDALIKNKQVYSPVEVLKEFEYHNTNKGDEVLKWCKERDDIFIELSEPAHEQNLVKVLSDFPDSVKYDNEGPDADPILIALAMGTNWTVVTRDGSGTKVKTTMKVKQICDHYKIRCITEFDFLKENGWSIS